MKSFCRWMIQCALLKNANVSRFAFYFSFILTEMNVFSIHFLCLIGIRKSHLSMVFETTSGFACCQIPETQSFVPWSRQSVVAIRWQYNVTDEMWVTVQTFLWNTIVGFVTCQFPYDQCLICNWECTQKGYVVKYVKNIKK